MNDMDKKLNVEDLGNVSGGISPRYPAGVNNVSASSRSNILKSIGSSIPGQDPVQLQKPFTVCPRCHSEAISFNREENICMCQDCGYCEDRSK